ncbi:hypothetical protein TNCV_4560721, partial [Trichonephila clavipes]
MTTCIPGIALMEFYHHLPSWATNEQMSHFSSFSDEWSRDLENKRRKSQRRGTYREQRSCR